MKFSSDFENFLSDLGSMVYNSKGNSVKDRPIRRITTIAPENYRRREDARDTPKEVLGDMLMMKLVSYYEDKYKLNHDRNPDQQITEKITVVPFQSQTHRYYNRRNDIDRSDMRATFYNINRRANVLYKKKNFEDPMAEVVVL